jgi:hypothetical protein
MTAQQTIDRILHFDRNGLPVVSFYVAGDPTGSLPTRVNSLLDQIRQLAKDQDRTLDHEARLSIRGDLERIVEASAEGRWKQGTTAVFSCSGRDFFEEVSLPRALRDRVVVDTTPWVRPMLAILDEYHRMCVAVVDKASAELWELYLNEIRQVRRLQTPVLRKPDFAYGMQEHKVQNKAEELAKTHYRRVATVVEELYRANGFDLLAVGGHPYEMSAFTEALPRPVRERLAGTFSIDAHTATPADVQREAESIMDNYESDSERQLVTEIIEAVAERRRAALGLDDCLWAGTLAAIDRLAVQESTSVPGVVCDPSGWLALSGETCPLCGEPTRPTGDVINDLVEAVIDDGGSVEHVAGDTDLRTHIAGALLRFPLSPKP